MVILNREHLAFHWKKEIQKFIDIPEERVIILTSENLKQAMNREVEGDVYIVLHQTLQAMAKSRGDEEINELMSLLGIGVKVYDECHEFIQSSFRLDCFSSVAKTFYLTATLTRTNSGEDRIFRTLMLGNACEYSDRGVNNRRHIHYLCYGYHTGLNEKMYTSFRTYKGFSVGKYISAVMEKDPSKGYENAILTAMEDALTHEGQILLVTPLKKTVDYFAELFRYKYGSEKSIGTMYSNNLPKVNQENQKCDIIVSTIKSSGTGFNPANLQCIICAEPHSSKLITHQLKGRLDRYPGEETYFYDLIDLETTNCDYMLQNHREVMEKFSLSMHYERI